MTGNINSLVVGIHLLGIVMSQPVIKAYLPFDEGDSLLAGNLNSSLPFLPTIEPAFRPAAIAGIVEKYRGTTGNVKALYVYLKGGKRIYKAAVSGLLINFFFCASPQEDT